MNRTEKKTEDLGQTASQYCEAQEHLPDTKQILQTMIQEYTRYSFDLQVLYDMLPTEMTNQQKRSLNKILSSKHN